VLDEDSELIGRAVVETAGMGTSNRAMHAFDTGGELSCTVRIMECVKTGVDLGLCSTGSGSGGSSTGGGTSGGDDLILPSSYNVGCLRIEVFRGKGLRNTRTFGQQVFAIHILVKVNAPLDSSSSSSSPLDPFGWWSLSETTHIASS
jgi:hypothetical protein